MVALYQSQWRLNLSIIDSHIHLAGSQTLMAFVGMFSQPQTTRQLYYLLKGLLQASLEEVGQRSRRTSSTTIFSSVVAVLVLIGHGLLFVDAIAEVGNATNNV